MSNLISYVLIECIDLIRRMCSQGPTYHIQGFHNLQGHSSVSAGREENLDMVIALTLKEVHFINAINNILNYGYLEFVRHRRHLLFQIELYKFLHIFIMGKDFQRFDIELRKQTALAQKITYRNIDLYPRLVQILNKRNSFLVMLRLTFVTFVKSIE